MSYEPNELRGEHKGNKKSITDVLVMMNDGTIINIEAQKRGKKEFHKRSRFYQSKIHSILLKVGENYKELPKTIMINILDFNLHKLEDYHTTFTLCEKNNKDYTDDMMEIHYIDLTVFRKRVKAGKIDLNDPKDRLTLLLDEKSDQKLVEKVIKMDSYANAIYEKTLRVLQDEKEYLTYIRAQQAEMDRDAELEYAKEKEGEKREKIGREEREIEIATDLKNKGISFEIIAETTGLPLSKIKKL